ncbi:MAG: YlbF family regulator [Bacilli bacterium]
MNKEELFKEIDDIKENLYNEPLIKEYFRLANAIKKNKELIELTKEIEFSKKNLVPSSSSEEDYKKELATYNSLKEKYNSNPLIVNFLIIKEQVKDLISEIKDIIQI